MFSYKIKTQSLNVGSFRYILLKTKPKPNLVYMLEADSKARLCVMFLEITSKDSSPNMADDITVIFEVTLNTINMEVP